MFFLFFVVLVVIIVMCYFLKIEIDIKKLDIRNSHIEQNYLVYIYLKIFNNIAIYKKKIDKNKFETISNSNQTKKTITKIRQQKFNKNIFKIYKFLEVKHLNMKIYIDTIDAKNTALIVGTVSSFLEILLNNRSKENKKILVVPLYSGKNFIFFSISVTISINIIQFLCYYVFLHIKKLLRSTNSYN